VFDLFQLSIGTYNNFLYVTVKAVNDPVEFFTDQIRAAFRDPEPNDYQLIRLFVARSEVIFRSLICSVMVVINKTERYFHLTGEGQ
jgi:hypothetical protein